MKQISCLVFILFFSLCAVLRLESYKVDDSYGMGYQSQRMINAVTSYFNGYGVSGYSSRSLANALRNIIKKESQCFGPSLNVTYKINDDYLSQLFTFRVFHNLSKDPVCIITVNKKHNSYQTSFQINPNCDGCLISSDDDKLYIGKKLEAIFVMEKGWEGKRIKIGNVHDFRRKSKYVYKVCQLPCVNQKEEGVCGFGSLCNILHLKEHHGYVENYDFMLNRSSFECNLADWERYIYGRRRGSRNDGLSNVELKRLINNKVHQLCHRNVILSFFDVDDNIDNWHYRKYNTFSSGGSMRDRIKDFQRNGTPQYIIASTSIKKRMRSVKLDWDDRSDRLSCLPNHWIALKIEWKGISMNSPVILTVVDSGGPRDNRYAALIHWYYKLFAHG